MKRDNKNKDCVVKRGEYGLQGVCEAARRISCSPTHISRVLNGKRKSVRLLERLDKANVKIEL